MNPAQPPVPIQTIPGYVITDMFTYKSPLDHFTQLTIITNQCANISKYLKPLHAVHEIYFKIMKDNPQLLEKDEFKSVNNAYAEMYQVVQNDATAFNFLSGPLPKYRLPSASRKVAPLAIMPSIDFANEDMAAVEEEDIANGSNLTPTIVSKKRARKQTKPVKVIVQENKSRTEHTSSVVRIEEIGNFTSTSGIKKSQPLPMIVPSKKPKEKVTIKPELLDGTVAEVIGGNQMNALEPITNQRITSSDVRIEEIGNFASTSGIKKSQPLPVIIPSKKPKEKISIKPELLDGTVAEVIGGNQMNALVPISNQRITRSSTGNSKHPSFASSSSSPLNRGISQPNYFVCHCGRTYLRPKTFITHQASHVMNYRCTNGDCKIETNKKTALVRHILVKHFNMPSRYNKNQEREWRKENPTVMTRMFIQKMKA